MPDEPVTPDPAPDAEPIEAVPTESADQPTAPAETAPVPEWQNWRYTGPPGRIYSNIPVTVTTGAIITWHSLPATDGAWQPTDEAANTLPDNHRPEPAEEPEEG